MSNHIFTSLKWNVDHKNSSDSAQRGRQFKNGSNSVENRSSASFPSSFLTLHASLEHTVQFINNANNQCIVTLETACLHPCLLPFVQLGCRWENSPNRWSVFLQMDVCRVFCSMFLCNWSESACVSVCITQQPNNRCPFRAVMSTTSGRSESELFRPVGDGRHSSGRRASHVASSHSGTLKWWTYKQQKGFPCLYLNREHKEDAL